MKPGAGLWLGVGLGFALLATAWTLMFFFAGRARVQSVPLQPVPAAAPASPR